MATQHLQHVNSHRTRHASNAPSCRTLFGGLFTMHYRACSVNEYMVKTGMGVSKLKYSKKTMQWPFQTVTYIPMAPYQLEFDLNMMSSEKVPFKLPMVWTVGPYSPEVDEEGFLNFGRRMSSLDYHSVEDTVAGIVHGTTRTLTAQMTIKELFEDREIFKTAVHNHVEMALREFGIRCYNSNIAEMKDLDSENRYFENLKQKALEEASADARVAVAEARKAGDIGEAQRQADAKVQLAATNARLLQQENARQEEIALSRMNLQIAQYKCYQQEAEQKVEAEMAPQLKKADIQTTLNQRNQVRQVEFLRATKLAEAIVENEAKVRDAEANATATLKAAEAKGLAEIKIAEAKAQATRLQAEAQADGLNRLVNACPEDPDMALRFVALQSGLFGELADKSAKAIQGLAPKINIWSMGGGGGSGDGGNQGGMGALANVMKLVPPVLDAVQSQTGIQMPNWMPSMPQDNPHGIRR